MPALGSSTGKGRVLWAAVDSKIEAEPYGQASLVDMAESMLQKHGPMKPAELVVAIREAAQREYETLLRRKRQDDPAATGSTTPPEATSGTLPFTGLPLWLAAAASTGYRGAGRGGLPR